MFRLFDLLPITFRRPASTACAFALAVGLALSGSGLALGQAGTPAAPYVANAPGVALGEGPPAVPRDGFAPLAPGIPRGAKPVVGEVAADDYRIGPQDLIEIQVFGIENLKREVRVNSRGAISLPLIGTVILGGLTGQEAEALVAAKYEKDYLQDPQVSVFIKEFTSQRITLAGAVAKPGVYPIRGQTTLVQALAIAGGAGALADMSEVTIYRRDGTDKKIIRFDIEKIRLGEIEDPSLVNDDVVVVARAPGRVALRESLIGDIINIVNPFNYLPRY